MICALLPLVIFLHLVQLTSAQRCHFFNDAPSVSRNSLEFHNQSAITATLGNCTTVVDSILISSNYTGDRVDFSGIRELSGDLIIDSERVTEVLLNDLEHIYRLDLSRNLRLKNFTTPKLVTAGRIRIAASLSSDVEFPALTSVGDLTLSSTMRSFAAPLLRNASTIEAVYMPDSNSVGGSKPYNFSLPSLEYTEWLYIRGEFTGISLPKLERVVTTTLPYGNGLTIDSHSPLDISLPSLTNASIVKIYLGTSLSLPLLRETRKLSITVTKSTNIALPSLQEAIEIDVRGNVTDVSLPILKNVLGLYVGSDPNTNVSCKTVTADWARMNITWSDKGDCADTTRARPHEGGCGVRTRQFSCYQRPSLGGVVDPESAPKKGPSEGQTLGLGVGLGIGALFVLTLGVWWWVKRMDKNMKGRGGEMEMDGVTIVGEASASQESVTTKTGDPPAGNGAQS